MSRDRRNNMSKRRRPTNQKAARETASPEADGSRSPRRLMGLLQAIALSGEGVSLVQLSKTLHSPKSSLLTLLRPLTADGYLLHSDRRYQAGRELFALASHILAGRKITSLLRDVMEELRDRTGETIILVTLDRLREHVSYVEVIESRQAIRYAVSPGTTRPLYASAAGQLLLAFQPDAWRADYLSRTKLAALTARTITDAASLRRKLIKIRRDGLAVSNGEAVAAAAGVAAPIFDGTREVVAAILIGAPLERAHQQRQQWCKNIRDAAAKASRSLGYRTV